MNSTAVFKIAGSALFVGTMLIGANPIAKRMGIATASDHVDSINVGADAANAAVEALRSHNTARAVSEAEQAVAASPRTAAYRALLGQAYLQAGRLASAETALGDALALDPENGRASLSLALVQIALGKPDLALQTLREARGTISATDHGLALALAGESTAAIDLLEPAARASDANGKTRQNLALAYAFAGKWAEARAIAAQDVSADQIDQRMANWAQLVRPQAHWEPVAALLGIKPVEDAGQPERLALGPIAAKGDALASADDVTTAPAAPDMTVAVSDASGALRKITFAPHQEIVQSLPTMVTRAAPRAMSSKQSAARSVAAPVRSGFVVQLGAYSDPGRAQIAWSRAVGRFADLGNYQPGGAAFSAKGASLYRVAARGFATRGDAERLCARFKSQGGSCFVRPANGEAPMQWALRASGRLAAR